MLEILGGIALIVLASRTAPALAARLSGQVRDPEYERRLRDVEERLNEVQERLVGLAADAHDRLLDLEERVDFTERVLQQNREQEKLEPGEPRYEH